MTAAAVSLFAAVCLTGITSCRKNPRMQAAKQPADGNGISVVTTIFAPYDFARQVTRGTGTTLTMLLPPGAEVHSWEPTAQDMIRIQDSSLFIYAGGEGDVWADKLVSSSDRKINAIRMTDCVKLFEEAHPEGMEPEEDDDAQEADGKKETEWDEHVWVSPANAMSITQKICDVLCSIDSADSVAYKKNTAEYLAQLTELDDEFKGIVKSASRKTVVFADRFPCRYFVEEFGLSYYAAFPGCASQTEPSAATVAYIIGKVKEEKIPVVFYIEMSNQKMADTVCEATGAKKMLFHCLHNLSKEDFSAGRTYLSLMHDNAAALKEALN